MDEIDELEDSLIKRYCDSKIFVRVIPFSKKKQSKLADVFVIPELEEIPPSRNVEKSYSKVVQRLLKHEKRIFIQGDPGYGKSITSLTVVQDWCHSRSNFFADKFKILIFLRLRQLEGINSIDEAVKRLLGGKKENTAKLLTIEDLTQRVSVLIIFDGYDEYPDKDNANSWVMKIISKEQLSNATVITTGRFVPKFAKSNIIAKLNGFNQNMKEKYITNSMECTETEADKLRRILRGNHVLNDFCQCALLFALFVHVAQGNREAKNLTSVTALLAFVFKGLHSHLKNKWKDHYVEPTAEIMKDEHSALEELSYIALIEQEKKPVWNKEDVTKILRENDYKYYINAGILHEDDHYDKTKVSFYHYLFAEWFAARFVTRKANDDTRIVAKALEMVYTSDWHYFFRFVCGLSSIAAEEIIPLFMDNDNESFPELAALCLLEKKGDVEKILPTVEHMCSQKELTIDESQRKIVQRSKIHLMEIVSLNRVAITETTFSLCSPIVKESNDYKLHNGIKLPNISTLQKANVEFHEEKYVLNVEDFETIISYFAVSDLLSSIVFRNCTLPFSVKTDGVLPKLARRKVEVRWSDKRLRGFYTLQMKTGQWAKGQTTVPLQKEEHQTLAQMGV